MLECSTYNLFEFALWIGNGFYFLKPGQGEACRLGAQSFQFFFKPLFVSQHPCFRFSYRNQRDESEWLVFQMIILKDVMEMVFQSLLE